MITPDNRVFSTVAYSHSCHPPLVVKSSAGRQELHLFPAEVRQFTRSLLTTAIESWSSVSSISPIGYLFTLIRCRIHHFVRTSFVGLS
ncbi:hypothetical protein AcV5_003444 [Taiwanofungus camphoratus]|nr:hypothetical protein AcV5_003444 [Antrodia cinnamomea]